jgi:hypothetical protein
MRTIVIRRSTSNTRCSNSLSSNYQRGHKAIKNGVTLVKIRQMKTYQDLVKMKFSIANDDLQNSIK